MTCKASGSSPKGAQTRLSTGYAPCRHTLYVPPTSSLHNSETPLTYTRVTLWSQKRGVWETLSAPSAKNGKDEC